MPSSSLSDRLLTTLKNNRYVAVVVVIATIIGAVVQSTAAFDKFLDLIGLGGRAPAIYRPLADDLGSLERDMNTLGQPGRDLSLYDWSFYQPFARSVDVAAKPVCNAKTSVSELGDVSTRRELDVICKEVETIQELGKHSPEGAVLLARICVPHVKETREEISSRAGGRFWWRSKFFNRPVFGNLQRPQ